MVSRTAFHMVSFHLTRDLECFAVTFHGIRPPFVVQTWLQQYRRCPFFHSVHCSLSNPICFRSVWCWRNMIPSSAPGTSFSSSGSPEKFLFCTDRIVTTVLPNLVPPRHIGDCFAIHFLHWEFCDPHLLNYQNCPTGVRLYQQVSCKKPLSFSSSSRFHNLGLSGSENKRCAYPVRYLFCSRLHS